MVANYDLRYKSNIKTPNEFQYGFKINNIN
jgi:hypothetical protein